MIHDRSNNAGVDHDATQLFSSEAGVVRRPDEEARLLSLLEQSHLVCLYGPPGAGKSHLASLVGRSRGAARTCDLAGVGEAVAARRALMRALGADAPPQETPEALTARLHALVLELDEQVVILDHVDHLGDLEEFLGPLTRTRASVSFVTTSRRRISARGATEMPLTGMKLAEAVRLFELRARAVRPTLGAEDEASVRRICELVDGLPLGVELAAARVRIMSPRDLAGRLEERFDVLKNRRARGERHESIHAALEESWTQLRPERQQVLAACSIFEGPFDLAAAESVVGPLVDADVLEAVEELVDESLLQSLFVGESIQFELLRVVREFAEGELVSLPFAGRLQGSYDEFMVRRAEEWAEAFVGPNGARAFEEFERHADSIVALIERLRSAGSTEGLVRLLLALRIPIVFRGPLERYRAALDEALAAPGVPGDERSILAATYAEALVFRGDRVGASAVIDRARGEESSRRAQLHLERVATMVAPSRGPEADFGALERLVEDARNVGDTLLLAQMYERLGFKRAQANQIDRAWMAFSEGRELYRSARADVLSSSCCAGLGYVELRMGRIAEAIGKFEEALRIHSATASHFMASSARFNLAVALQASGEVARAEEELRRALEMWERGGFTRYRVPGFVRLGLVQVELGDEDSARSTFSTALRLGTELKDHHNAAIAYVERAALDHSRGRPVDFAELERMVPGISAGADPDAFASALVLLSVLGAGQEVGSLAYVNRLEELGAMFGESDPLFRDVVRHLHAIARTWHFLAQASDENDEAAASRQVARAWEWGGDLLAEGRTPYHHPFVRIWTARLRDFGSSFARFAPLEETFRAVLEVHEEAEWYRVDERAAVDLSTRKPLRLVLRRLIEEASERPGNGLDVEALAAAGWPGEVLNQSTMRNRVYTAVRFLREMDLEDVLVTGEGGYLIATDVALRVTGRSFAG